MSEPHTQTSTASSASEIRDELKAIRRRQRMLGVLVILLTLFVLLLFASVTGSLVNYYDGDALLFGGATVLAALLGFAFGWIARRA